MNQFNSRADAAKSRLDAEERSSGVLTQVSTYKFEILELISGLIEHASERPESKLYLLGSAMGLFRAFALKRSEGRIEYLLEQVSEDLSDTIANVDSQEERLKLIESKLDQSRFEELLAEAAIQATRASGKGKIERLARVAVSGATHRKTDPIDRALEFERHAVELDDMDVSMLSRMESYQAPFRTKGIFREDLWLDNVRKSWQEMTRSKGYGEASARGARSSFARLQARGLIIQIPSVNTINSPGTEPYAVLDEGALFLVYLIREGGATEVR
jgi:hypothetical protein